MLEEMQARLDYGLRLAARSEHREACVVFAELALQPGMAWVNLNLGNSHYELGEFPEAAKAFAMAVEAGDQDALLNAGNAYSAAGDMVAAQIYWDMALANGEDSAIIGLAWSERSASGELRAREFLRQAQLHGNAYASGLLGVWIYEEDPDLAMDLLRPALALMDDARAAFGAVLRAQHRAAEAIAFLSEDNPGTGSESLLQLGLLYEDAEKFREAETAYRSSIAAGGKRAITNLGILLMATHRVSEGRRLLASRQAEDDLARAALE